MKSNHLFNEVVGKCQSMKTAGGVQLKRNYIDKETHKITAANKVLIHVRYLVKSFYLCICFVHLHKCLQE